MKLFEQEHHWVNFPTNFISEENFIESKNPKIHLLFGFILFFLEKEILLNQKTQKLLKGGHT